MNLWKQFAQIVLPGEPRMIGEVVSVVASFGDQRCLMQIIPSGETLEVLTPGRSVQVGERYVIEAGKVVEEAPGGEVFHVEV